MSRRGGCQVLDIDFGDFSRVAMKLIKFQTHLNAVRQDKANKTLDSLCKLRDKNNS